MKIRYGIISVGGWARGVHIPNLNRIDEAEITALCSRSPQNLEAGLSLCDGSPRTYANHQDMLADPHVDAVIICSPNHLHASLSIEALEMGKHVLCEKPMALNVADCDRVIGAIKRSGKLFQIGLELRHSRFFARAKELIRHGKIGTPRMAWCAHHRGPTSKHKWRGQKEISGGPIFDVGIHYSDLLSFLTNSTPAAVSAVAVAFDEDGIWDCCEAVITLQDGTIGNYRQTLISRHGLDTGIVVLGNEGSLDANMSQKRVTVRSTIHPDAEPEIIDMPDDGPVHGFDGSLQQLQDFTRCIADGKPPDIGADIGRMTTALCEAIETSIAEQRIVQMDGLGMEHT